MEIEFISVTVFLILFAACIAVLVVLANAGSTPKPLRSGLGANVQYRICAQGTSPVPNGFNTIDECEKSCGSLLPTSIASGDYFIKDQQNNYVEPIFVQKDNKYVLIQNDFGKPLGRWRYVAPQNKNDGTLTWIWTDVSQGQIPFGTFEGTISGQTHVFPVSVSNDDPSKFGWILTNDNNGQIFNVKQSKCLNLIPYPDLQFVFILDTCFSKPETSSGFTFSSGGLVSCTPIA